MLFGGTEDVVPESFEESARGGEPGPDGGVGAEDVGAAQGGGGEPLVGADADHRGAQARAFVEEVPVAPALAVAGAADQPVLLQQADRVRDGRRADAQVLRQLGGGAAADWAPFDIVSVDAYGNAGDAFRQGVREYLRQDEQARYLREMMTVFDEEGVDTAFWFTFAGYEFPHRTDPRLDLDMASYGVCKLMPDGSLAPKRSFHAMAEAYRRSAAELPGAGRADMITLRGPIPLDPLLAQ